jgi:hypothetical protein
MPEISFVGLSPAQLAWLHHEDLLSNACLYMQCVAMTVLVWDCNGNSQADALGALETD